MHIYTYDEVMHNKQKVLKTMRSSVFLYPTDTVYGIGCNAIVSKMVQRVRAIKPNFDRPFSIIAPSKDWIREHCVVDKRAEEWLAKLPGPYTLILPLKNKDAVDADVINGVDALGVRIPDHWISGIVAELGYPLVSTSANRVGESVISTLDMLPQEMCTQLDFAIDEGEKLGAPSQLIHLDKPDTQVKRR